MEQLTMGMTNPSWYICNTTPAIKAHLRSLHSHFQRRISEEKEDIMFMEEVVFKKSTPWGVHHRFPNSVQYMHTIDY